jgi:putative membrane-bound dehydrogenase-like protein
MGLLGALSVWGDGPPYTGPQIEKRFPPLKVPAGFKAILFACNPLIEYPSVISVGPRPGAIFVAVDYMTGLGTEIIRRDEIRLVEDTDGDGYADRATVFARGFNSIQGLAYHGGTLYVMHAPYLTALRASKEGNVAGERRDLLTGLGLTPEQNPVRLHCANGVAVGHDGWLYLALGDNGVNVRRPEGDNLVLHGGGILRCRPDGRDLHVFATGLRNIYDVALDAELNVFVRDNENDGGTYMIRVCHSFHGADHGYPYLYDERPDEALPPLADLGLGSSAGGTCYLERLFPKQYRGNLFFCEWGRSVVRYEPRRVGSTFERLREHEFAVGAADDPYGFRPTDIVVQQDGSMMVSDWADGQRPNRGRGRIYRIASVGVNAGDTAAAKPLAPGARAELWLGQLDSDSHFERCEAQAAIERLGSGAQELLAKALSHQGVGVHGRLHAIWALARLNGASASEDLLRLARSDPEPAVRTQAVRAVADLADPVLTRHRLDAGPGDPELAARLAALGEGQTSQVLLEVVIALGRLRWAGTPDWIRQHLATPDAALAHAAMQALRRSRNWPAVLKLIDPRPDTAIRAVALRALAERFEPQVVDGLVERLRTERDGDRRRAYAEALTRVYKKPGPWVYWGYRPAPRPPNAVAWERSDVIAHALDRILTDSDRPTRLTVLRRMQREQVPVRLTTLGTMLQSEHQPDVVATILVSLRDQHGPAVRRCVEAIVRDRGHTAANRRTALAIFVHGFGADAADSLLALTRALEDGPVLADALRYAGKCPTSPGAAALARAKSGSLDAEVRAAAIEALGELRSAEGREPMVRLLQDTDARVRRAAAQTAGKLQAHDAKDLLLRLMADSDPAVRLASLESLRMLREPRVVPVAVVALGDGHLVLKALECVVELGGPRQAEAVAELARHNPSAEVLAAAVRALTTWRRREELMEAERRRLDRAVAEIHGTHGIPVRWDIKGPVPVRSARQIIESASSMRRLGEPAGWATVFSTGTEARVKLTPKRFATDALWFAYADLAVPTQTAVEFLASSGGSLRVWLNGQLLYCRTSTKNFEIDSDRFEGTLAGGANRLFLEVAPSGPTFEFQLRFRHKSIAAEHERLTQAVLRRSGNPERGRKLFFDVEKSLCLKCHRVGDRGEHIAPELTGVGSRFSRIYILESILEPSRTIAPRYGTLVVAQKNGQMVSGVKVMETEGALTLADNQGQRHVVAKTDIEERRPSPVSTMPEGLEKRFTQDEFIDLIAFLVSQKEGRGNEHR